MKKIGNLVYPLALVMLMSLAWMNVCTSGGEDEKLFDEYFSNAQMNEEKQAYITAAEWYVKAAEIKPDEDTLLLAAENFRKCDENDMFLRCCRRAAECEECTAKPWVLAGRYYLDNNKAAEAAKLLSEMPESCRNDETEDLMTEASGRFHTCYRSFNDAKPFHGEYFAACDGKLWGLADAEGQFFLAPEYDAVGAYDPEADLIPVCSEGIWKFVNEYGQTRFALSKEYTFLGSFGDGLAPFCREGKYGYIDLDYNESSERFEYAGSFSDGVAAVKKDGKWFLVNKDLAPVTNEKYDEIILDEYGFCAHGGVTEAIKDGKTVFLDKNGSEVSEKNHFSCGLAPVSAGSGEGYENEKGDIVIDAYFEKTTPFSPDGCALVKEDDAWKVITLDIYR